MAMTASGLCAQRLTVTLAMKVEAPERLRAEPSAIAPPYMRSTPQFTYCSMSRQARRSKMIRVRMVLAVAAIFYGVEHFLHPEFAPGVPLEMKTPSWVPLPSVWGYLAGAILLAAGIWLALNKGSRIAAASIGGLMTVLTVCLYLVVLILAHGAAEINEALNYAADTLLYAGAALALASALPRAPERVEKT